MSVSKQIQKSFWKLVDEMEKLTQSQSNAAFYKKFCRFIKGLEEHVKSCSDFRISVNQDKWDTVYSYMNDLAISEPVSSDAALELNQQLKLAKQLEAHMILKKPNNSVLKKNHAFKEHLRRMHLKQSKREHCEFHNKFFYSYRSLYRHLIKFHPETMNEGVHFGDEESEEPSSPDHCIEPLSPSTIEVYLNNQSSPIDQSMGDQADGEDLSDLDAIYIDDIIETTEASKHANFIDKALHDLNGDDFVSLTDFATKLNYIRVSENASDEVVSNLGSFVLEETLKASRSRSNQLVRYMERVISSRYLQREFIRHSDGYIEPNEYKFEYSQSSNGARLSNKFYYVPILQLLHKFYLTEELAMEILSEDKLDQSPYVAERNIHQTLRIILYADRFDVVDPYGDTINGQKVFSLYLDIDNNHRSLARSWPKDQDIPALLFAKWDTISIGSSINDILKPLVDDLISLKNTGISVRLSKGRVVNIPVVVSHILGDSGELCEMLGFIPDNVGMYFCCRFCGATTPDIKEGLACNMPLHISRPDSMQILEEEYNRLRQDKKPTLGVWRISEFARLGLDLLKTSPPDPLQDISSGPMIEVCSLVIQLMNKKASQLNKSIAKLSWLNGPARFELENGIVQLKGNQSQKFETFVRLPEMFPQWIFSGDLSARLYVAFREIIFYTFSPNLPNIQELRNVYENFFKLYNSIEPKHGLTAEMHTLSHYPELLNYYHKLVDFDGPKYQRKHSTVKRLIDASRCYRNVALSLANYHQEEQFIISKFEGNDQSAGNGSVEFSYLPVKDHPFSLSFNIAREILDDVCLLFIEPKYFLIDGGSSAIYVRGPVYQQDTSLESVGPILLGLKKVNASLTVPINKISNVNSYIFILNELTYINHISLK